MYCCNCWIKEVIYVGIYKYVFSLIFNRVNELCIIKKYFRVKCIYILGLLCVVIR